VYGHAYQFLRRDAFVSVHFVLTKDNPGVGVRWSHPAAICYNRGRVGLAAPPRRVLHG
jgi:hypothetical protein